MTTEVRPRRVYATMTSKNQVTIPQEVRERLGLKKGERLIFELGEGAIRLGTLKDEANPLEAFIGIWGPLPKDAKTYWREMRDGEGSDEDDE